MILVEVFLRTSSFCSPLHLQDHRIRSLNSVVSQLRALRRVSLFRVRREEKWSSFFHQQKDTRVLEAAQEHLHFTQKAPDNKGPAGVYFVCLFLVKLLAQGFPIFLGVANPFSSSTCSSLFSRPACLSKVNTLFSLCREAISPRYSIFFHDIPIFNVRGWNNTSSFRKTRSSWHGHERMPNSDTRLFISNGFPRKGLSDSTIPSRGTAGLERRVHVWRTLCFLCWTSGS